METSLEIEVLNPRRKWILKLVIKCFKFISSFKEASPTPVLGSGHYSQE